MASPNRHITTPVFLGVPAGAARGRPGRHSLLIFVCEAGIPPWYNSKADVALSHVYRFSNGKDTRPPWFNQDSLNSGIGQGLAAYTKGRILADAIWVAWRRVDGGTYLRCSVCVLVPGPRRTRLRTVTL